MSAASSGRLWAVIMAGGSGTRFWPESRRAKPKQFLNIFGKHTLLEQTVNRLQKVIPRSRVLVVTQQSQVSYVAKSLKISKSQVIGEPIGRNTAPCAALAAAVALKKDPKAVLAILPSDHRIGKEGVFRKLVRSGGALAFESGLPVTFGIKPAYPHTGYGYLELGPRRGSNLGVPVYKLKRFCEKPNLATARKFVRAGRYLWNSGMFIWRADELLNIAKKYQPAIYDLSLKIAKGNLKRNMQKYFPKMPSISIDYGLMEHMKGKILALPADMDWNDLGGWQAFEDLWAKDKSGNRSQGQTLLLESSGNIVKSGGRLVALLGVSDHVVVDTPDALLVCAKDKTESIRSVVDELKKKKLTQYL